MATHSGVLAWRIPWIKEPGQLQFMESQRVGRDWTTKCACTHSWSLYLLYSEGPALLSWLNSCYNIWERGGSVSYLLSSHVLVCSSLRVCFMTDHYSLQKTGGHKLRTGTCNLQTLVSLFWCWYLQNRHRGSLMSQVGKHQLFWAIFTQRNNRQGPFGAQCPKDHWWIKRMLSMNKLGCNRRTDHGEKEEPLPKIPMMVLPCSEPTPWKLLPHPPSDNQCHVSVYVKWCQP